MTVQTFPDDSIKLVRIDIILTRKIEVLRLICPVSRVMGRFRNRLILCQSRGQRQLRVVQVSRGHRIERLFPLVQVEDFRHRFF